MRQILFVDDDPQVLNGLKRMLHGQRNDWEMAFVTSGQAALKELQGKPFDVLVTDMQMPQMDGAALLKVVAERHPSVVRLVLSGHAEEEASLRALPVTHQFINKPCDAQTLKTRIENACALETLLTDPELRRQLGSVDSLPSLPRLYSELSRAIADENSSLRDVAKIVERDPGLCAKILQVVNSAFFGLPQEMSSVSGAVTYLGLNMLQGLVLTVRTFDDFGKGKTTLNADELQRHSLAVGSVARALLPRGRAADDAFAAGTLHDVGKLVIASRLKDKYVEVMAVKNQTGAPDQDAEMAVLGTHHGAVGGYLLGLWGLPHPIVEAVAWHHEPGTVAQSGFGALAAVHVADALVREMDGGTAQPGIDMEYIKSLGLAAQVPVWRQRATALLTARAA